MTEIEFEESRSRLLHYSLKNAVFQPLLREESWGKFCVQVGTANPETMVYPELDLSASSSKDAIAFWLYGDKHARPIEEAFSQLLEDADSLDFLRRRSSRSPSDDEIMDWCGVCTKTFLGCAQVIGQPQLKEFWHCAVNLTTFLRNLENRSHFFWEYFECTI